MQPKKKKIYFCKLAGLVWEPRATGHTFRTSRALSPQAETVTGKKPGSDPPADLGDPASETGGNRDLPCGCRRWGQARQGPPPTGTTAAPHVPFWTTPSSLLVPEAYSPPRKPARASRRSGTGRQPRRNLAHPPTGPQSPHGAGPRWRQKAGASVCTVAWVVTNKQGTESRMIHNGLASETSIQTQA